MENSPITSPSGAENEIVGTPENESGPSPRELIIEAATLAQNSGLSPQRILDQGKEDLIDLGIIVDDRSEDVTEETAITYNPGNLAPFTPARRTTLSVLGAEYGRGSASELAMTIGENPEVIVTLMEAAYRDPGIIDSRVQKVELKTRNLGFIREMYGDIVMKLDDEAINKILENNPRVAEAVNEKYNALQEDTQNGSVKKAEVLLEDLIGRSSASDFNPEYYYDVLAGHEAYQSLVKSLKLTTTGNGSQSLPPALTEIGQRLLHLRRAFEANIDSGQKTADRAGSTADLRGTIAQITLMRNISTGLEASGDPKTQEIALRLKNDINLAIAQGQRRHPGASEWRNFTELGIKKMGSWVELPGGSEERFPDNNADS